MKSMEYGKRYYTVKEVCRITGVTRKTLFYYDRIGLLVPDVRRGVQNHKMYDSVQIGRLGKILSLRHAGLKIAEIERYLSGTPSEKTAVLMKALSREEEELAQKRKQIDALHALIGTCD